jgi:nucleotide-binding universal stress UspA family protein
MARREPGGYEDQLLRMLEAMSPLESTVQMEPRLDDGDVAQWIVEVAQETGADLIVMGTHCRTDLGRLLLGSVAEQVLRIAPCSILTWKAPRRGMLVETAAVATERLEPSIAGPPSQEALVS